MQLYAEDSHGFPVAARWAKRQQPYRCMECGREVRVRDGGLLRRPHFFHLTASTCSLSGKGLIHLHIQSALIQQLPEGEAVLEAPFRSINRIADVAWHTERVIFEVQCAPIRPEEALARIFDYLSVGYQVIWILHCSRYGQARLSAVEIALLNHSHYYTDIDAVGNGQFYDSCPVPISLPLAWRTPLTSIQPMKLYDPSLLSNKALPEELIQRQQLWKKGCQGDWLDLFSQENLSSSIQQLKKEWPNHKKPHWMSVWKRRIQQSYHLLLQLLLEQSCRKN